MWTVPTGTKIKFPIPPKQRVHDFADVPQKEPSTFSEGRETCHSNLSCSMAMHFSFFAAQSVAFILGVLACWAFWYVLLHLTPALRVATQAAYDPVHGAIEIKVANLGTRQITDVQAHLALFDRAPEGRIVTVERGLLVPGEILALEVKRMVDTPWCVPTAYIFVCKNGETLRDLLLTPPAQGERRLVFTISARDAVSGTKRVQRVTYPAAALINGSYARGLTFSIVPAPPA